MEFSHLITSLITPFGALFCVLMAGVVGHEVISLLGINRENRSIEIRLLLPTVSVLFGSVVIAILLFIASMFTLMSPLVIKLLLLGQIILAFLRRGFWFAIYDSIVALKSCLSPGSLWTKVLVLSALSAYVVFVVLGLSVAIVPTLEADSATFYLNAANLFLQYHQIIDAGNVLSSMGRTGFLQLVYGLGIFSGDLAQGYLFALSATGMLLMFLIIGRISGYALASVILVIFITSSYALHPIIQEAKFDGYTFALSTTAITLLYILFKGERRLWTAIAIGLCAGFMSGITYNNLFVGGLIGLSAITLICRGEKLKQKLLAAALVSAIIGSAPTYIQNIILFDNPVYPFAGELFNSGLGTTIPEDSYNYFYMNSMKENNVARSVKEVLELPTRLFIRNPENMSSGQRVWVPGMSTQRDPWLGSLMLVAMAGGCLALFVWMWRRFLLSLDEHEYKILPVLIVGFWLAYLFWALNQYLFRYFSAGLPLVAFSGGFLLAYFWNFVRPSWQAPIKPLLGLLMLSTIAHMTHDWSGIVEVRMNQVIWWLKTEQKESDYIAAHLNYCANCKFGQAMIDLRQDLNDGDKVLSFGTGLFYFGTNVKAFSGNGSATVPSPHAFKKPLSRFADWREWESHIVEQDFKYLLINPTFLYLSDNERPIIEGYLNNREAEREIGTTLIFKLQ